MTVSADPPEFSGRVLAAQVGYRVAPTSLQTARALIDAKLRNCELLLTDYIRARYRVGSDAALWLSRHQTEIAGLRQRLATADRGRIFQLEAVGTKLYWDALGHLCRQDEGWHRVYPHAVDCLSVLLNTGYVLLGRQAVRALRQAGLAIELGILHGENSGKPLIYDFMEPFRQPLVDRQIVPSFSRRSRSKIERDDLTFKKILARLAGVYRQRFRYSSQNEHWERILYLEAIKLKQAILSTQPWKPFLYPWGHRQKTK